VGNSKSLSEIFYGASVVRNLGGLILNESNHKDLSIVSGSQGMKMSQNNGILSKNLIKNLTFFDQFVGNNLSSQKLIAESVKKVFMPTDGT
jgi:hypothetical protein